MYQGNNNFIFLLFLHVIDVFSSCQPFVKLHESSLFWVQTSSLNHQLHRELDGIQILLLFFIGARQSKFEQAETHPCLSLAILMIKINHFEALDTGS